MKMMGKMYIEGALVNKSCNIAHDVGHGAIVTTQLHDPTANSLVSFPDLAAA